MSMRHLKTALDVTSSLAVLVAAGVLVWAVVSRGNTAEERPPQVEEVRNQALDGSRLTNVIGSGRIAIIEFSDFQCPFCALHARDTFPTLTKEFVRVGDVRYVAMHNPLERIHPFALDAAQAAECASRRGLYWEMRSQLFKDLAKLSRADLLGHGEAIGIAPSELSECIEGQATLAKVRLDQDDAKRLGATGTPAFFLGIVRQDGGVDIRRIIRGIASVDVFREEVEELRKFVG